MEVEDNTKVLKITFRLKVLNKRKLPKHTFYQKKSP